MALGCKALESSVRESRVVDVGLLVRSARCGPGSGASEGRRECIFGRVGGQDGNHLAAQDHIGLGESRSPKELLKISLQ